jgi:hypothetical protein
MSRNFHFEIAIQPRTGTRQFANANFLPRLSKQRFSRRRKGSILPGIGINAETAGFPTELSDTSPAPYLSPVFVLGGAQTDFARNWSKENKHIVAMMREAMLGGLEVAAIEASDIETAQVGKFAAEFYSNQGHLGAFMVKINPAFFRIANSRHEAACASGSIAVLGGLG